MAYVLKIVDDFGTVVEHVSNHSEDTIHVDMDFGFPQSEFRKSHHLIRWVKENKPNWRIYEKNFSIDRLFS